MTDITELTSVQKNANIHRLSRLIAYAPNDELRQMAVEVEHYTDQLIEALEKAQQQIVELQQGCENDPRIHEIIDLKERIAELESRTVTVKLPDINEYLAEVHDKTLNRAFRLLAEGVRAGDVAAMRAAGIKVEAE